MESALTVRSVEIKPQGNTMEPQAVMVVKASSDAPYARAMCTHAGTDKKDTVCAQVHVWGRKKKSIFMETCHPDTSRHIAVCHGVLRLVQ